MRNTTNKAPLRSGVSWRIHDTIARKTCFHVDAWCVQDASDRLYFVLRTSAGGYTVLDARAYEVRTDPLRRAWELVEVSRGDDALTLVASCTQRRINDAWARRHAPQLEELHTRDIVPTLRLPREGFKGPHSIVLHYVWSDPRVSDPMIGLPNYHGMAGAEPHAVAMQLAERVGQPWNAQDRSLLRTLDKLLK